MNKKPKVSVIVPIYNMGTKIRKAVESVLNQDYSNLEIILVDDGSTDNSLDECKKLLELDERIAVYHTDNRGSGPARNYGIEKATGEFLYFPDADDYIEPQTITVAVDNAIATEADLVLFGYKDVDENGKILNEKKYKYAIVEGSKIRNNYAYYKVIAPEFGLRGAPWNKLFRSSIVRENTVEYPPLRRHQDEAFIARYLCFCKTAVFIEDVFYTYYTNDQKSEWKKYPVDYIDAVYGLYKDRKTNVLKWNTNDSCTKDMINQELICNSIKALELSFSPKFAFEKKERLDWMKKQIAKGPLTTVEIPATLGMYQRIIFRMIQKKHFYLMYVSLHFKVIVAGMILKKR